MVTHIGGWKAPSGIPLVIDLFSAIMLVVSSLITLCITLYSIRGIDRQRQAAHYYFFVFTLLMGINGAFISGDIFNLFVWFEVMLLSSFVLLALGNTKRQLENTVKYITINLVSSFLLLAGIGLLYAQTGTLNLAELSRIITANPNHPFITNVILVLFLALAIKAALFPFFFWLPAAYYSPPVAISALFSASLTKVGVYALIRFFTLFYNELDGYWTTVLLTTAGFTMLIGVLAAASQMDIRKILSFHIISQIGYMIMGLGIFTPLALAGSIYFIVHNIFAKSNAFLIGGIIKNLTGSFHLKQTGGLLNQHPILAVLFLIPALALAGVPPTSGFFGKFILIKAAFETDQYIVAIISILVSFFTLYSMMKIWNLAFWKEETAKKKERRPQPMQLVPSVILGSFSIFLGIGAGFAFRLCYRAAEQLLDSSNYINSVLTY